MTEEYETKQVKIKIKPCLKCGSNNVKLWDCGYSAFNIGGGKCFDCEAIAKDNVNCLTTKKELAKIWNDANDTQKEIKKIDERIKQLIQQKDKLIQQKDKLKETNIQETNIQETNSTP